MGSFYKIVLILLNCWELSKFLYRLYNIMVLFTGRYIWFFGKREKDSSKIKITSFPSIFLNLSTKIIIIHSSNIKHIICLEIRQINFSWQNQHFSVTPNYSNIIAKTKLILSIVQPHPLPQVRTRGGGLFNITSGFWIFVEKTSDSWFWRQYFLSFILFM